MPVVAVVATAEPETELDAPVPTKLPDYQPIRSFLEKASPPVEAPKVYVTLTPTDGPMSLERRAIETAAVSCFDPYEGRDAVQVTMTLETRADGTIGSGTIDGTSVSIGSCLLGRLATIPIHEEGKPQHIVIVLAVSFG